MLIPRKLKYMANILIIYVTNNLVMEHKRNSTKSDCKK
jgi:hypothetical protein